MSSCSAPNFKDLLSFPFSTSSSSDHFLLFIILQAQFAAPSFLTKRHHGTSFHSYIFACMISFNVNVAVGSLPFFFLHLSAWSLFGILLNSLHAITINDNCVEYRYPTGGSHYKTVLLRVDKVTHHLYPYHNVVVMHLNAFDRYKSSYGKVNDHYQIFRSILQTQLS